MNSVKWLEPFLAGSKCYICELFMLLLLQLHLFKCLSGFSHFMILTYFYYKLYIDFLFCFPDSYLRGFSSRRFIWDSFFLNFVCLITLFSSSIFIFVTKTLAIYFFWFYEIHLKGEFPWASGQSEQKHCSGVIPFHQASVLWLRQMIQL